MDSVYRAPHGQYDDESRVEIVDAEVARLVGLGASVLRTTRWDEGDDSGYYTTLQDPEGNEFCVS